MLPINQQVTFLYVRDLERTREFYENVMLLPLVLDQGFCCIYRVTETAFMGFCTRNGTKVFTEDVILTLVMNEDGAVDRWHSHLLKNGVTIEKPPTFNPIYNIYHLFLRDPDGYLLEIQTFRDMAWPRA